MRPETSPSTVSGECSDVSYNPYERLLTSQHWSHRPKLLAFIHLPFHLSRHILKYVLSYHVVPDLAFFSDFIRNDTESIVPSDAFITRTETDVEVPMEWITEHQQVDSIVGDAEWSRIPLPKMPDLPRGGPRDSLPHYDGGHPSPPHHKANVTHYELPTLLSTSGENVNATLKVAVVAYRFMGRGPIKRSVIVLPAPPPHHGHGHEHQEGQFGEDKKHDCPHKKGAKPVKVFKADLPARNGAVHVSSV